MTQSHFYLENTELKKNWIASTRATGQRNSINIFGTSTIIMTGSLARVIGIHKAEPVLTPSSIDCVVS